MASEEADVIVVGGGAVGLTMATELAYRGISCILVERNPTTSTLAKAVAISSRSMEHYRRLGLQERIQDASYPRDVPFNFVVSTSAVGGKIIFQKKFSSWGEIMAGVPGAEFPFCQAGASAVTSLFCPQFSLEPILKEHLETSADNLKMFWGMQMTSLSQDEEGVTIKAVQTNTSPLPTEVASSDTTDKPQEKLFRAKYLVGCDGGSSSTRKQLGIHTYGEFVVVRAVSITFRSPELYARMKEEGRAGFASILNQKITAVLITLNSKGEFALHTTFPRDTNDEMIQRAVDHASQCVKDAIGANIPHTVVYVSSYNMHALISTKYGEGRCFLTGDSAHQWLPAGGLGMNTGISDAVNLAWKLEAVLKGYGGPHLLDSYMGERMPIADTTRRFALSFGRAAGITSFSLRIRSLIIANPFTRFFLAVATKRLLLPQITSGLDIVLGFQYSASGVIVHERDSTGNVKLNPTSCNRFVPSSLPGCRAPHVALPDCASILDLFGKKFVLLDIGGEETDLNLLIFEMKERGLPFETYSYPKLPELVSCYDRKYFLVRPDGIIAWRADFKPSGLEAKKIVSMIVGDVSPKRFSLPPLRLSRPPRPPVFVVDGLVSAYTAILLKRYTDLPVEYTIGAGLGIFWLLRALHTRPLPRCLQQVSHHRAVVQNQFGKADEVLQIDHRYVRDFDPKDVLVRVHAASVNPFDISVRQGYGAPMLSKLRGGKLFPLILGRDCSGEVVAVGDEVTKFLPGDLVFGAASVGRQGTHSQYVTLGENELALKPINVDHREAAALPWVATTTWTALVKYGGLTPENTRGKKILVHAGTGGVGSFAIQFLKAWGAEVATTCSTQNVNVAHYLGADKVIDYTSGDFTSVLKDYDVIFNTVIGYEKRSLSVLKCFGGATYISIIAPKLFFVTKLGSFFGQLAFSWLYRFKVLANRLFHGRAFYYSIAEPDAKALEVVAKMVERGEIRPLIDAVYSMDEIIAAHKHVEGRHTRGKVVVSMV